MTRRHAHPLMPFAVTAALLAVVALLAYGDHYGTWPGSTPTELSWCGRDYRRGDETMTAREAQRFSFDRRLHATFRAPPVVGRQVFSNLTVARGKQLARERGPGGACSLLLFMRHGRRSTTRSRCRAGRERDGVTATQSTVRRG